MNFCGMVRLRRSRIVLILFFFALICSLVSKNCKYEIFDNKPHNHQISTINQIPYLCGMIRITKIFTFETAHVLYNYDGKCKNMHGHSYKLFVTVKGNPINDIDNPKNGMVVDFGDIKKIVNEEIVDRWDHAVLVNGDSPHRNLGTDLEKQGHKVILCNFQPTCENMLYEIASKIKAKLPNHVHLAYLKLHETENSYGEWLAEEN